jgi:hypothetical protein
MLSGTQKSAHLPNLCAQTEPFMASKEKAERLFKRKQEELADRQMAKSEYEQNARGEREKMAKLRALRLARDANVSAAQVKPPARRLKKSEVS